MTPLEKMNYFEVEISKATLPSNLLEQQSNFERLHSEILRYLDGELRNADPDSRTTEMIIGKLKFIKEKHMTMAFMKDPVKKTEMLLEKIAATEESLKTEINIIKKYIGESVIVKT